MSVILMTGIAACRQLNKSFLKSIRILLLYRGADTTDGRVNNANTFYFGPVGTILLNIVKCFAYLMYLEIGQFPIFVCSGKPEFGMMLLYVEHKFTQSGFVGMI